MADLKDELNKKLLAELSDIEKLHKSGEINNNLDKLETFMTKLIRHIEKHCFEGENSPAFKRLLKLYNDDGKLIYMSTIIAISKGLLEID